MNDHRFDELLDSPLADPGRDTRRRRIMILIGLAVSIVLGTVVTIAALVAGRDDSAAVGTQDTAPTTTQAAHEVPGIPGDRVYARMVATGAGILMFGGLEPVQNLNGARYAEVWRYAPDAERWWDQRASNRPEPRAGAAIAYDSGSEVVVLFGGATGGCRYPMCSELPAETWVYDPATNTWEQRFPAESPPGRHGHAMAYDSDSDRVVMFGGDSGQNWLEDTWTYDTDANRWMEVSTNEPPWRRALHAMAYDPDAGRVVLWGGADRDDTLAWAFDLGAAVWEQIDLDPAPQGAWDACLVWDPATRRTLLIGGEGYTTEEISAGVTSTAIRLRDEVWSLDLETPAWTQLDPLPRAVTAHGCALDPGSGMIIVWTGDAVLQVDPATGGTGPAG